MAYVTLDRPGFVEETARNSRFLGFAQSVSSVSEFEEMLWSLRRKHPDASHHCWAYRVGDEMRYGDDGEPGGTAGRPILEVVLKRDLDRVAVIVVRYFGGIRLGAGGLARAYGGTAAKVLAEGGERRIEDRVELLVHVPFAGVDSAHRLLQATRGAHVDKEAFDDHGWRCTVTLPVREGEEFRARLAELTRGEASCETRRGDGRQQSD